MEFGFTTAAYVVAAVLFILSLGGLSGQESAKRAVWYGIAGMALAVAATLVGPGAGYWFLSIMMIAAGGAIGYQLATKVQMTQMPELVAAMPVPARPDFGNQASQPSGGSPDESQKRGRQSADRTLPMGGTGPCA